MTTGLPTGEGGAVTVTRMEELSSPFSFWANTLDKRIPMKAKRTPKYGGSQYPPTPLTLLIKVVEARDCVTKFDILL